METQCTILNREEIMIFDGEYGFIIKDKNKIKLYYASSDNCLLGKYLVAKAGYYIIGDFYGIEIVCEKYFDNLVDACHAYNDIMANIML